MKSHYLILVLLSFGIVTRSTAEIAPQGTLLDNRVRTIAFNENQVYKITAYYGYQVDIEMADNEEIKTVAAGDTVGWQIVSAGQHLFIKPMAAGARTNLSVITNRRTYLFDLAAASASDKWDMTYLVRFKYPQSSIILASMSAAPSGDPASFNFDYKIRGSRSIRPTRVFDDGLFTFFQFGNPNRADLPAIFWISPDNEESLVNYRVEGPYVVVERVADNFLLRSGSAKVEVIRKTPVDLTPTASSNVGGGKPQ